MMSRNDFEILARTLKAMYPTPRKDEPISESHYRDGYNTAINQVVGACSSVNARFNIKQFKLACGVSEDRISRSEIA